MKKIQAVALPILAVLMLSMSACTAPQPVSPTPTVSPSPTSTPSSTPSAVVPPTASATPEATEPAVEPVSIVVQADSLLIRSNGEEQEYPYEGTSNASKAIEAVTAAYGFAGEDDYSGDQKCWYQMTTYSWPGLDIAFSGQDSTGAQSFLVHVSEASETVEVSTPHGAHVGDLWEPYLAELNPAPELILSGEYEGVEYARTLDTPTTNPAYQVEGQPIGSGVIVLAEDGVISYISAPDYINGDC